jgi:hypothetical protein
MSREFSNPAYITPGVGGGGSSFVALSVANSAARLALPQIAAVGNAVIQSDDSSVWALKAAGHAVNTADWTCLGTGVALPAGLRSAAAVAITGGSMSGVALAGVTFPFAASVRTALGIGSADNTADVSKPVSTAQAAADAAVAAGATTKANNAQAAAIAAASADATTKANAAQAAATAAASADATTKSSTAQAAAIAAAALDATTKANAAQAAAVAAAALDATTKADAAQVAAIAVAATKSPLASPVFTGAPSAPTAEPGTASTQLATTEFVTAAAMAGGGGSVDPLYLPFPGAPVIGAPATVTVTGTHSPPGASGVLVEGITPAYPGMYRFKAAYDPEGSSLELYSVGLEVLSHATLDEIAPAMWYVSMPVSMTVWDAAGLNGVTYHMHTVDGVGSWMTAGHVNANATVIPAGWFFRLDVPLIGGLGAIWEEAPDCRYSWVIVYWSVENVSSVWWAKGHTLPATGWVARAPATGGPAVAFVPAGGGTPSRAGRVATDGTTVWISLVNDLTGTSPSWKELP